MQCRNTAYTIYQKFGMTHLMSRTGQHLLLKASTNVPWPITTKLCILWSHNQDHWPWQQVHSSAKHVTGQFLPLHILYVCTFQTNRVDTRAADRDELDGRSYQDVTAPRSTQRPNRQGGARFHLHHALQRQLQRAGKISD